MRGFAEVGLARGRPELRSPDVVLAGLSIWTLSRQFPNLTDYWDGNWLNMRARVAAEGARVEVSGPLLRIDELADFEWQLAALHRDLKGTAVLAGLEPGLKVRVACGIRGDVTVRVEITPDHMSQHHWFEFGIDQSYLNETLRGLRAVLQRFPVIGTPGDG